MVRVRQTQTRTERECAASRWLAEAAGDARTARREWATRGVATLRLGGSFSAVRIPPPVIYAAAGTSDPAGVDPYLAEAVHGPIFAARRCQLYYALVPVTTGRSPVWSHTTPDPDVELLGRDSFLGVPHPTFTSLREAPSYWCVPMEGPGDLCTPAAVAELVACGQRAAEVATDD